MVGWGGGLGALFPMLALAKRAICSCSSSSSFVVGMYLGGSSSLSDAEDCDGNLTLTLFSKTDLNGFSLGVFFACFDCLRESFLNGFGTSSKA